MKEREKEILPTNVILLFLRYWIVRRRAPISRLATFNWSDWCVYSIFTNHDHSPPALRQLLQQRTHALRTHSHFDIQTIGTKEFVRVFFPLFPSSLVSFALFVFLPTFFLLFYDTKNHCLVDLVAKRLSSACSSFDYLRFFCIRCLFIVVAVVIVNLLLSLPLFSLMHTHISIVTRSAVAAVIIGCVCSCAWKCQKENFQQVNITTRWLLLFLMLWFDFFFLKSNMKNMCKVFTLLQTHCCKCISFLYNSYVSNGQTWCLSQTLATTLNSLAFFSIWYVLFFLLSSSSSIEIAALQFVRLLPYFWFPLWAKWTCIDLLYLFFHNFLLFYFSLACLYVCHFYFLFMPFLW